MTLDYSWSYDPIFPAPIFEDAKVGALLRQVGIEHDHRGNHVMAFFHQETALALLSAPQEILDAAIEAGFSLTPHTKMRAPSQLTGRVSFLYKELTEIIDEAEAGKIDDEEVKARVWSLHMFLGRHVIRRVVADPDTKKLTADPELVAATKGKGDAAFDLVAFNEALEEGPHPLPSCEPAQREEGGQNMMSLTAAVLFGAGEASQVKDKVVASGLLDDFAVSDLSPGSFTAEKGDTMIVAMSFDAPYPEGDLKHYCAGNALAQNAWEIASPAKEHVHIQLMRRGATQATREDALMLAHVATAIGGQAVIWSAAKAAVPMETFAGALEAAGEKEWPLLGMVRMTPYKQDDRQGVALTGLEPFLGHEMALATDLDASLSEAAGRLLSLAGWALDTKPVFADGDTMGVEGSGTAQLRIHDIKGPDGISTFELRPYDGPPAKHSPEDRARDPEKPPQTPPQAGAAEERKPAKRPFWKFWAK